MSLSSTPALTGRVIIDIAGTSLTDEDRQLMLHPALGGLIFFSRNIQDIPQLQALIAEIRAIRPELILCIDQEGGRVQRLREPLTRLPALQRCEKVWQQDADKGEQLAEALGWLMASEILSLDIDLSFAPVLDLDRQISEVIGDRAFSADMDCLHALACAYLAGMRRAGMAATGKHFPGHGGVAPDSHAMLPYDDRPFDEIADNDLLIFQRLLPQLPALMTAHIIFQHVDDQPVAFSAYWLKTLLREQLGYQGLVFCDDLNMAGAKEWISDPVERGQRALAAGCDLLLLCNHREDAKLLLEGLRDASPFPLAQRPLLRRAQGWHWNRFEHSSERQAAQQMIDQLLN
jgi:beta-N-acetylhexosaminidase